MKYNVYLNSGVVIELETKHDPKELFYRARHHHIIKSDDETVFIRSKDVSAIVQQSPEPPKGYAGFMQGVEKR